MSKMTDDPSNDAELPKRSAKFDAVVMTSIIIGIMLLQAIIAPGGGSS